MAGYIRLSNDDGNDLSYSVINQQAILSDYISKLLEVAYDLEFFIDDGISGTTSLDREGFQKMLVKVYNDEIDIIIVKDLSRLARNTYECLKYIQNDFVIAKIRFISISLPYIDSVLYPESLNSMMVPIQSAFDEYHSQSTSIKILQVYQRMKEQGKFLGAFAPYGYLKDSNDKHHLVIDEEVSSVVKDMYYWRAYQGLSCRAIAERLNQHGVLSPRNYKISQGFNYPSKSKDNGNLWWSGSVKNILLDQCYLGHMVQSKSRKLSYKIKKKVTNPKDMWIIIENTHEPIVSQELFDVVAKTFKAKVNAGKNNKTVGLFSGLMVCADCHKRMTKTSAKKFTYYICTTNRQVSKEACSRHSIRSDYLEEAVLEAIKKQIATIIDLSKIANQVNKSATINSQSVRLEKRMQQKEQEYKKINRRKDGLYDDYKDDVITKKEYLRLKERYELELKKIEEVIRNIQIERDVFKQEISKEDASFNVFLKDQNINKLDRGIVVELIDAIYVHHDKSITIKFSYSDRYVLLLEWIKENSKNSDISININNIDLPKIQANFI